MAKEEKKEQIKSGLAESEQVWPMKVYADMHRRSLEDPERFWAEEARKLDWYKTWDKVLEWKPPPTS